MKAERTAIEHTLRQVHWNRRKAVADPRRQLQDAAEQDQGVRDQPRLTASGTRLASFRDDAWVTITLHGTRQAPDD